MASGKRTCDEYVTTGVIGELCNVSPKSVAKWIDSGLLQGSRMPGGTERRVLKSALLRFLKSTKNPLPPEFIGPVVSRLERSRTLEQSIENLRAFASGDAFDASVIRLDCELIANSHDTLLLTLSRQFPSQNGSA